MFNSIFFLILSLGLILLASEGFTNGIEAFGRRLSYSQAVVGSILAAVGTALPETILPMVAILFTKGHAAKEIGVGAILGAPFMISTLAFFLVGVTVLICSFGKRREFRIDVELGSVRRDLSFFIPMYAAAVFIPLFTGRLFAIPIAILLICGYIFYVNRTINGPSAPVEAPEPLYVLRLLKRPGSPPPESPNLFPIVLQIALSLLIMIFGARMFVDSIGYISLHYGMDPLLFSLMIAPIATELPEKFNSVNWTIKGKDTLAIGNLTGAMVFQSTFPVSVGLLFTPWRLSHTALLSAVIALIFASILLITLVRRKRVPPYLLLLGGLFYLVYVIALCNNGKY